MRPRIPHARWMISISDVAGPAVSSPDQQLCVVLAIDEALDHLASRDPEHVRIVELRFFTGLSVEEIGRRRVGFDSTQARYGGRTPLLSEKTDQLSLRPGIAGATVGSCLARPTLISSAREPNSWQYERGTRGFLDRRSRGWPPSALSRAGPGSRPPMPNGWPAVGNSCNR